jgi:hypothetical protein
MAAKTAAANSTRRALAVETAVQGGLLLGLESNTVTIAGDRPLAGAGKGGRELRWERLFADLEAEFDAAEESERAAEIADRVRQERGRLRLVDRLRGSIGRELSIRVLGVGRVEGTVGSVGPDWVLLRLAGGGDRLIRLAAVLEIVGLAVSSAQPGSEGEVAARFGCADVLRRLVEDRAMVTVTLIDGGVLTGTMDLVGLDVCEVSDRRLDEPSPVVLTRSTVPIAAIATVREI